MPEKKVITKSTRIRRTTKPKANEVISSSDAANNNQNTNSGLTTDASSGEIKTFKNFERVEEPSFNVTKDKSEFSPFKDDVIIRDSGFASNTTDNTQPISQEQEIPPPDFTPEVETFDTQDTNEGDEIEDGDPTDPKDPAYINPDLDNLTDADKFNAAKSAATEAANWYCNLKPMGFSYLAKPSKKSLDHKIRDGIIDPEIRIQTQDGVVSLKDSINSIQTQAETIFTPKADFKTRIIPPLTKIFMKRGIGMTPEQEVLSILAEDVGTSVLALIQLRSMTTELLEYAADITKQVNINTQNSSSTIDDYEKRLAIMTEELEKEKAKNNSGSQGENKVEVMDEGDLPK
jgi:hypothetical protein